MREFEVTAVCYGITLMKHKFRATNQQRAIELMCDKLRMKMERETSHSEIIEKAIQKTEFKVR